MNLFLRLFYVLTRSFFRERLPAGPLTTRLHMLTFPNDLDVNFHVNNGRYLTLCDLSRVDYFIRSGLARLMLKRGWMPVISEHTMVYKKSLKAFQRFELEMSITHWDEKFVYMQHRFVRHGKLVAEGTSKGAVVSKAGVVQPQQLIDLLSGAVAR
jgi:acyl-CoA thioesterase FadM